MEDDYYNPAFHFCKPPDGVKRQSESLGSILFGDRIFNSPYDVRQAADNTFFTPKEVLSPLFQLHMLVNETCKTLCKPIVPPEDATFINERIREDQVINWVRFLNRR